MGRACLLGSRSKHIVQAWVLLQSCLRRPGEGGAWLQAALLRWPWSVRRRAVASVERTHSRGNSDRSQSSGSDALVEAALDEATAAVDGGDGVPGDGAPDAEPGKGDGDSFCSVAKFESALQSAFNRTDEEFGKADNAALVGTTAVVALVGSRHLYVANCGARLCLTVLHTTPVMALTYT